MRIDLDEFANSIISCTMFKGQILVILSLPKSQHFKFGKQNTVFQRFFGRLLNCIFRYLKIA